jgi:ParB-like chromosome segregation protein Spo0J
VKSIIAGAQTVAVAELREFPNNPRRGDVELIMESLSFHGQYRPIVANRRTKEVLAGWHTLMAARKLGWQNIQVTWIDVDPITAKRIVLADNRMSDLASYDDTALLDLLMLLSDLEGTGFNKDDLLKLEAIVTGEIEDELLNPKDPVEQTEEEDFKIKVKVGKFKWEVEYDPFFMWKTDLLAQHMDSKERVGYELREMLGFPPPEPKPARVKGSEVGADAVINVEQVPVIALKPLAGNARTGDIGAITQSLMTFGQYRPVVARRDGTVLVGNHTVEAARALKWEKVSVVWLDVDDEEAIRIAIVDNRTTDMAGYNAENLKLLLSEVNDYSGTGFTQEDVSEIYAGGSTKPGHRTGTQLSIEIGEFRFRVTKSVWDEWRKQLPENYVEVELIKRLQLPLGACWKGLEKVSTNG